MLFVDLFVTFASAYDIRFFYCFFNSLFGYAEDLYLFSLCVRYMSDHRHECSVLSSGVDPKSILCEHFKVGQCAKGFKCKFSHDLNVQRKGEKIDIYSDQRDQGWYLRVLTLNYLVLGVLNFKSSST